MEYKEKLIEFIDSLNPALSENIVRWAVNEYVNKRKNWAPALNKALKEGEREARFQANRERLKKKAGSIIANAISDKTEGAKQ